MRNTTKLLIFLLCVMMLLNTLSVNASAVEDESPIKLAVSAVAESGSMIQVQILANKAQTVADGKLVVTFDAEKLAYVDTRAWSDQVTLSVNPTGGKVTLAFASAEAAPKGELFTLRFHTTADAVVAIDGSSYISGVKGSLAQQIRVCPSTQFLDVRYLATEVHEAVDYMVANGYMNGMSDTMFGPNMNLSRGMMVTILYRIAGNPPVSGSHPFVDVPNGEYYADAVLWAAEKGITDGVDDTHFAPSRPLTRQELVTFLHRFAGVMGYDRTASTSLDAYTDAVRIQPYAVEAFRWAVAEGVVQGTSETTLDPTGATTRAQISLMVSRLLTGLD